MFAVQSISYSKRIDYVQGKSSLKLNSTHVVVIFFLEAQSPNDFTTALDFKILQPTQTCY